MVKITIVFDNQPPLIEGLYTDWGFSALIEIDKEKNILFDTGGNGEILLHNMGKLGIEPQSIDEIFISHNHHDHTGGLRRFLMKNDSVKLWLPASIPSKTKGQVVVSGSAPYQLYEGVYSTGVLEGIEQSLVLATSKGLMLIVGCSHPRMDHIRKAASQFGQVYGIVGGLHSTKPKSLSGLRLICATHCTQHLREIKTEYPDAFLQGGAGQVIEVM